MNTFTVTRNNQTDYRQSARFAIQHLDRTYRPVVKALPARGRAKLAAAAKRTDERVGESVDTLLYEHSDHYCLFHGLRYVAIGVRVAVRILF
jgi:hypothetical protein